MQWRKLKVCFSLWILIYLNHLLRVGGVTLAPGYDKAYPPSEPLTVFFRIYVQTVAPIQSAETEFRVNMRWIMSWTDERIAGDLENFLEDENGDCETEQNINFLILTDEIRKQIWKPDPYIVNAKYSQIKKFDSNLEKIILFPNHTLEYTIVINATVACDMDFEFYPMDIQICPMIIQSFIYDSSSVQFSWYNRENSKSADNFYVATFRMIQFMVVQVEPPLKKTDVRFEIVPLQGNVSQLIATFRFERLVGSYLVQSFIPSSLVVLLSWFSFWLTLDITAARGFLLSACILSLQIHLGGLKADYPPVAYVKAVDIWIFGCMLGIFFALAEFILVKIIYNVTEEVRRENRVLSLQKLDRHSIEQYELESFDAAGELVVRENLEGGSGTELNSIAPPYAQFWIWQELQLPTLALSMSKTDRHRHSRGFYTKRRLGSVIFSGRSVATDELPLANKRLEIFGCFGINLPLVWEVKRENSNSNCRTALWLEIDNVAKWAFPLCFGFFASVYWITLWVHAILV